MTTYRTLILFVLLLGGCSSERKGAQPAHSSPRSHGGDTLVTLTIDGVPHTVRFTRDAGIDLANLQSVINDYRNKPLAYQDEKSIDVTGDGSPETILNRVVLRHDTCLVTAVIRSGPHVLYADTLVIPTTWGNDQDIWGYDSTYVTLLPYSLFFMGLENTLRVFDANPPSLQKQTAHFLAEQAQAMKERGMDSVRIAAQLQDWEERVRNYRGKLIWNLSLRDRDTYIWDSRRGMFIVFVAP